MSSLIFLQQVDPGARSAPKSVPNVKKLSLSEFLVCSVCQKLGVYRHLPMKAQPYFLLPNKRAGGKRSNRRRVWHFMDRERRPRERRDPEGRSVWDFTYNHEAAGSDVWLKPGFSSSSAQPSRPFTKPGTKKNVRSPLRLFGSREYDISSEGEGRLDEVSIELAPSDHSNDGEFVA